MSTIKISQLPALPNISANTSNTLFLGVDLPTDTTGKFTATTLAEQLYANNVLNVGQTLVTLPNVVIQGALSGNSYVQTNFQNLNDNGTFDIVITANNVGTDSVYFFDAGLANKNYAASDSFNNIGTSVNPLDGYLYIQGLNSSSPGGNLIIGTTTVNRTVNIIAGGGGASNVVASFANNTFTTLNPITFADGTTQNSSSLSAGTYANAAYSTANTAVQEAVTSGSYANSAYTKANAAVANTSTITLTNKLIVPGDITVGGITYNNGVMYQNATMYVTGTANITGNLITTGPVSISGNTMIAGTFIMNAVNFSTNTSAFMISAAGGNAYQAPSNTDYMMQITGRDNYPTRVVVDSFGSGTYSLIAGRGAQGTAASPTATQAGDVLMRLAGNGYNGTSYASSGVTHIDVIAVDNFTSANQGAQIVFSTTATKTNTISQIASFSGNTATFTGTVNPTKGFIYTPTTYPGAQTAITIDFSNNSVVRAQTATGLTVSFTNYTAGKIVDMWITNTAGTTQTFTHGVSATNSTVNATTYGIPGTSTIFVRYMCFDGDLANTFVAITHA